MPARKILILDDSEICRDVVKVVLEQRGYEVIPLDSPFGFGAALNKERPDLVLLDAQMPGIPGDKLVQIVLRHSLHRCPILFYSELAADQLEKLVRASGASGFVEKTSDGETLARIIEMHLRRADIDALLRRAEEERNGPGSALPEPTGPLSVRAMEPNTPGSGRAEPSVPGPGRPDPLIANSGRMEPIAPGSGRMEPTAPGSGRTEQAGPVSARLERRDSAPSRPLPETDEEGGPKGRSTRR